MTYKILTMTLFGFLLLGCGKEDTNKDRSMKVGESYTVATGDKVVKASEATLIKVIHKSGKKSSTVSLLEGSATITYAK